MNNKNNRKNKKNQKSNLLLWINSYRVIKEFHKYKRDLNLF